MKPPPFEYYAPSGVADVLELLAEHGDEAKLLAGGQSLVPLLNFRVVRPSCLIDINGVVELDYVRANSAPSLLVGALSRQAVLERSREIASHAPLLVEALAHVGHMQIRNRGTVGGSAAHADPAAELPAALAALNASFRLESRGGSRVLGFEDFFVGIFTTALAPDELLTTIEIPRAAPGTGSAFCELSRRHGDFALGGAAVVVTLDASGACEAAAIALLAAAPTPLRARAAEEGLRGQRIEEETAREAARRATDDIDPPGDIHAGSPFRRRAIEELVRRALLRAGERAEAATR